MASFGAETQHAGWRYGAEVQAAGERFEDAGNTQRLGGYGVVNLFVATTLMRGVALEGRIDNIGDKDYELARTYATPGRYAQLTLRWTMP
ncbi:MAG TPA: TonB-dependent receptor [Burkholderiaceae bacterium]|nr:TonB-dependent receptor [Burkholderiaceae bacterium]